MATNNKVTIDSCTVELGLSTRATNTLESYGLVLVRDILNCNNLLLLKGFGIVSYRELQQALKSHGLLQAPPAGQLQLTLSDIEVTILQVALAEYIQHRGPNAKEYVDRRYPSNEYPDSFREDKIKYVSQYCFLAEELRNRLFPS